jgi:hypothetical protein
MSLDEPNEVQEELRLLNAILEGLQKLSEESRQRVLQTVATYFKFEATISPRVHQIPPTEAQDVTSTQHLPFSQDRSISPKQFLLSKEPKTDVERVACLAYYLTHYRETPHFKTLDISKLNTEAAQLKFSNATVSVDNAAKSGYLVPAVKGLKQISALGEQFVLALPDRDRAKSVMLRARPRRRQKKALLPPESDQE